jgi:hypothetical protein
MRGIDQRAFRLLDAESCGEIRLDGLGFYADPAAADEALDLQLLNDGLGGVGRNGKADADRAARQRVDSRVDAYVARPDASVRPRARR